MNIDDLLVEARSIWGDERLSQEEIVIRMGVILGDMNRLIRDYQESGKLNEAELKKEMGNTIFSMTRWCDDLGYSPIDCIQSAKDAQKTYAKRKSSGD